jgi:hypothetical protein
VDALPRALPLALAGLVLACNRAAPPAMTVRADLDGDGQDEVAELRADRDPVLRLRRGRREVYRGLPARWRPWKLAVGDVDGDGRPELALGIVKATRFFPFPHDCLFLYDWDGRRLAPRWLGSSLSQPFSDFTLADVDRDGRAEVIAVEDEPGGGARLAVYSWSGFGFRLDWVQPGLAQPHVVAAAPGALIALDQGVPQLYHPPQGAPP